jgi:hypothetical protein
MYHNTLVLLVLKEIFNDPYLVNTIYRIIENDEINNSSNNHKIKSKNYKEDIQLLFPGLLRTAFFENIRFDIQDDLDPGYSFYPIKPLTNCGITINYDNFPFRYDIPENKHKDSNGIALLNNMRKKYSLTIFGKNKIEILINKRNVYAKHELYDKSKISLWYDFENKVFTN